MTKDIRKFKLDNAVQKAKHLLEVGNVSLGSVVMERALSYLPGAVEESGNTK